MRTKILCCLVVLTALVLVAIPAMASTVAQGKCINYDTDKKILVIEEYNTKFSPEHKFGQPTGQQSTYDVSDALIGAKPEPGNIMRIAYDEASGKKKAIRVMNITKQDLMKK
jgi:hypothetical protein